MTNGRIRGRFVAGSPILLLTATGRRTGKRRSRPLAYVRDGERFVLCASNGGSPRHPDWYHMGRAGAAAGADSPSHRRVVAVAGSVQSAYSWFRSRAVLVPAGTQGAIDFWQAGLAGPEVRIARSVGRADILQAFLSLACALVCAREL